MSIQTHFLLAICFVATATSTDDDLHRQIDSLSVPVEQKWAAWMALYNAHDSTGFKAFEVSTPAPHPHLHPFLSFD
jgi:hypothetical protein